MQWRGKHWVASMAAGLRNSRVLMASTIRSSRALHWAIPDCMLQSTHDTPGAVANNDIAHQFLHEFRIVMALVGLVTILHSCHATDKLTAQTMRLAHYADAHWNGLPFLDWARRQTTVTKPTDDQSASVTLLRFSQQGFDQQFCGLSPVPRAAMALVIARLADSLPEPVAARSRPVIGIDVDITTLQHSFASVADQSCRRRAVDATAIAPIAAQTELPVDADKAMIEAIKRLSSKSDVVAVAFPRAEQQAREARNNSMKELCDAGAKFASPRAFLDPGEPFYRFLNKRKPRALTDQRTQCDASDQVPPVFPSLGNLISLAAQPAARSDNAALPNSVKEEHRQLEEQRQLSLNMLCEAVRKSPQTLLLSVGDPPSPCERKQAYAPEDLYNWDYLDLMRGIVRTQPVLIDSIDAMELEVRNEVLLWKARSARVARSAPPMLILAIDDGYTDRYFTVQDGISYTPGDRIQAVMALSQSTPLKRWSLGPSALLDLLFGCVYLALWLRIRRGIYSLRRVAGFPSAATGLIALAPAGLAVALGGFAIWCSAWMLQYAWWVDPVLVLLGLTVHTYVALAEEAGVGKLAPGVAPRRPLDKHIACSVSLVLWAIVGWAFVLIVRDL